MYSIYISSVANNQTETVVYLKAELSTKLSLAGFLTM